MAVSGRRIRAGVIPLTIAATLALLASPARALDKQGAAHKGDSVGQGFGVSGSVFLGALPINPSYAARPDNTGRALLRAGAHLDVDLIGHRLFIPIDLNVFTDRGRPLVPSELDLIGGVATTWPVWRGDLEVGVRGEHDRSVDQAGKAQTYGDVRARYSLSAAELWPGLGSALREGDLSGWLAAGWFFYNPSYFARPDNTGRALLRYVAHAALSVWKRRVSFVADANFFSDRQTDGVSPTELDLTLEIVLAHGPWDLHFAYERDMPLDRGGLVQQMGMIVAGWSFE